MAVNKEELLKKYNIAPPPKDINNITIAQAKEEIKKLTNVTDGTGFLYFLLVYVKVSHSTKGFINLSDNLYKSNKLIVAE